MRLVPTGQPVTVRGSGVQDNTNLNKHTKAKALDSPTGSLKKKIINQVTLIIEMVRLYQHNLAMHLQKGQMENQTFKVRYS